MNGGKNNEASAVPERRFAIRRSLFFIKILNWEYWPMWLANLPLVFIWLWFALRAKKLFFFSAVNPVIKTGGMWGESKYNIIKRISGSHLPTTIFIEKKTPTKSVFEKIDRAGLSFPIIVKPDVGERGTLVSKIKNKKELSDYIFRNSIDFIVQEFIDLPVELAVMHHRLPNHENGEVTSICVKKMLSVTGDGHSNIGELMAAYPRAVLQLERFEKSFPNLLLEIPALGEKRLLEPIGNHCRGTMFLNRNNEIDDELTGHFNRVAEKMEGIYYGRFDLKCRSINDLRKTGFFKIMEYNGIGGEPAHIYDPAYPVFKKYRDIYRHWRIIFRIYKEQKKRGFKGMSFNEAWRSLQVYRNYQKSLKA